MRYVFFFNSPPLARAFLLWVFVISSINVSFAYAAENEPKRFMQSGKASWYGTTAHGKLTASGDIFRMTDFSAAHKTLPFGTVIRVHNQKTGRHVLVRINDRGPFAKGRVVDLSKRAARNLRMIQSGVASVVFEAVSDTKGRPLSEGNAFYIRLMDVSTLHEAFKYASQLEEKLTVKVSTFFAQSPGKLFSLCTGPYSTFGEAEKTVLFVESKHGVKDIIEGPAAGDGVTSFILSRSIKNTNKSKTLAINQSERYTFQQ